MRSKCTVYKITCKINGKSYIGATSDSLEIRWRQHVLSARKPKTLLDVDISLHGASNFSIEQLEYTMEEYTARYLRIEKFWVFMHDTIHPKGYNRQKIAVGNNYFYIEDRLIKNNKMTPELRKRLDEILYEDQKPLSRYKNCVPK